MLQSGLLGLGCSLVDLPCFQLPLVAMSRSELLAVSWSGQFVGSRGSLLVARFARSILSSLVTSSVLVSVVAKLVVEVIRGVELCADNERELKAKAFGSLASSGSRDWAPGRKATNISKK